MLPHGARGVAWAPHQHVPAVLTPKDVDRREPFARRPAIELLLNARTVVLAACYAASVALLFASRVREFADESDNLLGGLLLTRGYRLYVDYFSSHMPLAYYVAAAPALLGAERLEHFRVFSSVLLVLVTLGLAWAFRRRVSPAALGVWATITVFAHTVQWGEMLTAGTCAAFGIAAAGLLAFTTPRLRFDLRGMLCLSVSVAVAVQSELLSIFPLAVVAVAYVAARVRDAYSGSWHAAGRTLALMALVIAAPHVLVVAGLWAVGALGEFVYDAYVFNQTYYAQFLMNPSILGMLHDWEAQYRTLVLSALANPIGIEGCLIVANVLATVLIFRGRGPFVAVLYYLFIALTHVRNSGGYYVTSYFSLALLVVWAVDALRTRERRLLAPAALVLALGATFAVQVGRTYDLSGAPARSAPEVAIVQALTEPNERIFVAPYDPYIYLASGRAPASTLPFYFPWQALDPRSEGKLLDDLRTVRPPLVIFRRDELVNDRWLPRDYGTRVLELLERDYVPLDPSSAILDDVFVRRDRRS